MQARVFIIHSEEDRGILKRLINEYNEQTFGNTTLRICFLDSKMHESLGEDFGKKIEKEIIGSRCVIAIISKKSKKSAWVNQEIGYAKGKEKKIIPMKEKALIPKSLGFIHSNIDAQPFTVWQKKFEKLENFFEKIFEGKRVHKVVGHPTVTPVKESHVLSLRRAKPDAEQ